MSLRINNSCNPYSNSRVSFGHNQGVLDAVEALKKRVTPNRLDDLQAHLQDIEFTPDFVKTISGYSDDWKKTLVKYSSTKLCPKEIQDGLKRIFGME
jgi:aminopeptidase-like protein